MGWFAVRLAALTHPLDHRLAMSGPLHLFWDPEVLAAVPFL